jgi:hypothetical protein
MPNTSLISSIEGKSSINLILLYSNISSIYGNNPSINPSSCIGEADDVKLSDELI